MLLFDDFRRETMVSKPVIPMEARMAPADVHPGSTSTGTKGVPLGASLRCSPENVLFVTQHFPHALARIIPQNSDAAEKMNFLDNINA
jgi:hypothetical protein